MKVTVILCTYNRSQSLAKALESVADSTVPESLQWEVLVVDNNSRDQTRSVVEEYCRRYPARFRYLFESKQGKSHALNSGCQAANADILAFMDDDVEVDSHWLYNLTAPMISGGWAGVGGRILPEKGFVLPPWVDVGNRLSLAPLAIFDLGTQARELREAPFGTNMAFRKQVFAKYGEFRTDLGPQPGSEIRDEDTEFGLRVLAAGDRLWYEPSAIVYHDIPAKRAQREYFQTWWFAKGRAGIRDSGIPKDAKWRAAGVPIYFLRRYLLWMIRWMVAFREPERTTCKFKASWLAGVIFECYEQAHQSTRRAPPPG